MTGSSLLSADAAGALVVSLEDEFWEVSASLIVFGVRMHKVHLSIVVGVGRMLYSPGLCVDCFVSLVCEGAWLSTNVLGYFGDWFSESKSQSPNPKPSKPLNQVRVAAIRSICTLASRSRLFRDKSVDVLIDMLSDEIETVKSLRSCTILYKRANQPNPKPKPRRQITLISTEACRRRCG